MPIITVKPDGQKLLIGWYDRRNDPQNGLIDLYALVASTSALDNGLAGLSNFRITTASFPPVFTGTTMTDPGEYDPIYPINGIDLTPTIPDDDGCYTTPTYIHHVGEYNAALSDATQVYLVWTDNRNLTQATLASRNQADVRACRFHWP